MNAVKQERDDEAEIQELAAKFAANKAKMLLQQQQQQPKPTCQSMNILSFLTDKSKQQNKQGSTSGTPPEPGSKSLDDESAKGRFGWTTIGKIHIPYIIRSGESYCAVRMVEMRVLNKLLSYLHQDLYSCTNIRSYYITEAEARLLNEINFKHCDYQFGREQFTSRDLIVRTQDATEFFKFLGHCYNKLVNSPDADAMNRCGFIRINRESVVPYTIYGGQKYVPLFYFEGETENLKQRADKLEGWDLSYLKFCCKVQGIRNELFAHDSCSVISLNDIRNYFPPGTTFEDYWPKKNLDSQLLITDNSRSQAPTVQWTRQPTAPPVQNHPPPSPKPATQAKAASNSAMHNVHVYPNYGMAGGQPPFHAAQPMTASSAVKATYPSRHSMRPSTSYYGNMPQAPPPLIRASPTDDGGSLRRSVTVAEASNQEQHEAQSDPIPTFLYQIPGPYDSQSPYTASSQSNPICSGAYIMLETNMNQNNYHSASTLPKYPPPLLHMNGGLPTRYEPPQTRYGADGVDVDTQNRELQKVYGGPPQLINQQPAHQQSSARSTTTVPPDDRQIIQNGRVSSVNNSNRKLLSIPEPPAAGIPCPYKIQKALVEGELLPCINMKPFVYSDLLVTLSDFISTFFPNVPLQSCQQVMQVLGIGLYKPNASQMRILIENGKSQNASDTVPLVQVRNVINYMPQLKYMLNGMITPDISSKRQRSS